MGLPPARSLKPGEPSEPESCAIANTIKDGAKGWSVNVYGTTVQLEMDANPPFLVKEGEDEFGNGLYEYDLILNERTSKDVERFVDLFDNEVYPELVAK